MQDATKDGTSYVPSAEAYDPGNDMWGDQDADMDDGQDSCPPLLKSDDEEPYDPFAAMCEDSPRAVYDANTAA
eukprot:12402413-Karenia_brevis.AAC.1